MIEIIISYIAGAVSGSVGVYFYLKRKMKQQAKSLGEDEEFQEMINGVVGDTMEMLEENNESEK